MIINPTGNLNPSLKGIVHLQLPTSKNLLNILSVVMQKKDLLISAMQNGLHYIYIWLYRSSFPEHLRWL